MIEQKSDFQAEYEDSIPFTRSSLFEDLAERLGEKVGLHSDNTAALLVLTLALRPTASRVG